MSKFDYEYMSNDDVEMVVFNQWKYHNGIVLRLAIFEGLDYKPEDLEIIESYVRFGFYKAADGEVYNGWHISEIVRKTPPTKFEIPVWVVIPKEMMTMSKEMKHCSECNKTMTEGYCIEGGIEYYCSDECLHKHISPERYEALYDDGDSYWTSWEE